MSVSPAGPVPPARALGARILGVEARRLAQLIDALQDGLPTESVETLGNADLPPDWNMPEWDQATQDYGSAFLASRRALALAVPSARFPQTVTSQPHSRANARGEP